MIQPVKMEPAEDQAPALDQEVAALHKDVWANLSMIYACPHAPLQVSRAEEILKVFPHIQRVFCAQDFAVLWNEAERVFSRKRGRR